ncbi:MAG: SLC13/DASS family transporter [Alphaproteobacteria bacterium]|nr:SLC13/DASS family transporter [Alphaproteobacteria bacterium]MCB9793480.1 SLC13/DASS family transporter [Alphaproteobacteria bacterium]
MSLRSLALPLGPALALAAGLAAWSGGLAVPAALTAGVTVLCAVWWVLEPIPIPATSMLPFVLLPLTGVVTHAEVASAYGHHLILLLMGGFILSTAMERSGAHRRLALGMVRLVGGRGGRRLVLGFMLASASLSMWISNTATTLMLLPIVLAVLSESEDEALTAPLLLGVAYAASIGGLGTPVGTPPNVIFMAQLSELTGSTWSFLQWMAVGVPVVLGMLPLTWAWLTRKLGPAAPLSLPEPGPWRSAERRVLLIFGLTALLWVTRAEPGGGWAGLLAEAMGLEGPTVGDSTVAMGMAALMFLIPDGEGERLLDWPTAARIPWGMLLLFGGGIALAKGFSASGLNTALGAALAPLASLPRWATLGLLCLSVTFLTEVTSNTATTNLLMPVLGAAAISAGQAPEMLMVPAAISASCAFMLPVATVPNAVVYGSERIPISIMAREGVVVNLIGVLVITAVCAALL